MDEGQIRTRIAEVTEPLRRAAAGHREGRGLQAFTENIVSAATDFVIANRAANEAQAPGAVGITSEGAPASSARVDELQERGSASIRAAKESLAVLRTEVQRYPKVHVATHADRFHLELRKALAQSGLKPNEIGHVQGQAQKAVNAVRKGDPAALVDFLDEQVTQLEDVGTRGTDIQVAAIVIPLWMAVCIAIFLGVALWSVFWCAFWGECWLRDNLPWELAWQVLKCVFFGGCGW